MYSKYKKAYNYHRYWIVIQRLISNFTKIGPPGCLQWHMEGAGSVRRYEITIDIMQWRTRSKIYQFNTIRERKLRWLFFHFSFNFPTQARGAAVADTSMLIINV